MDVKKIISKLSGAQKGCLKYPNYSRVSDDYYVEVDDCVRLATIKALIKKGLLEDGQYHYWYTDNGESVRKELSAN